MLHSLKRFWLPLVLLLAGAQSIFGFAMIGPYEPWQTGVIGYNLAGDDGAPKNLSDGYRWNTRTLYYACDASFADFFGSNGIVAIDQAFAVFNSLTNLSSYSANLSEWPLNSTRYNYAAEALNLLDLKSTTMSRLINLLGLAQPDRYLWTIHNRYLTPGTTCPSGENYVVVQRNFDPATYQYTSYINGTLYDYLILEACSGPNPLAISPVFAVDPTDLTGTAVAAGVDSLYGGYIVVPGRYYTGLTRDDVGGLRYLMATNRMNVENVPTNTLQLSTNQTPQILVTSNLAVFSAQALTNNPAALLAIYPNLIITSTNYSFTNFVTAQPYVVYTPVPGAPYGTIAATLGTNYTTNVQALYYYTFANVYTNHAYAQQFVLTQISSVGGKPGAPYGTLQTNINSSLALSPVTNGVFYGDFYILPTNLCGPYVILSTNFTNITAITNIITITNLPSTNGFVNLPNLTNFSIAYFTNYYFIVEEVNCLANSATLRQGLDKINFVRRDFDSILGTFWSPITNVYQLTAITNGTPFQQTFRRVVSQPDILIEAKDQIGGPANPAWILTFDNLNFNSTAVSSDGAGPGTIEPPITLVYGKGGGPIFWNTGGFFQREATAQPFYQWGSFDGSTNNPIVYPDGTSLADLESQVYFQVATTLLPAYSASGNSAGNPYSAPLSASGGTPAAGATPYTWSLAPTSAALPPGLTLSSDGIISGVTASPAGTIYDFVVQATDAGSRSTQTLLSIVINP